MLVSARTAPKARGIDDVLTLIVYGEEKDALANEMEKIAKERNIPDYMRDAKNTRDSDVVVLVGVRSGTYLAGNCGACGYPSCAEFSKAPKKRVETSRDQPAY